MNRLDIFFSKLNSDELKNNINLGDNVDKEVVIDEEVVDWDFRIIKCVTFEELVRISSVEIASGIIFNNCTFKKGIVIRGLNCKQFDASLDEPVKVNHVRRMKVSIAN